MGLDDVEIMFTDLEARGRTVEVERYADLMSRARFCLCPAGDTPTSRRLFDAIVAGRQSGWNRPVIP